MLSNCVSGGSCPEESGENVQSVWRTEGSIQIASDCYCRLCGHLYQAFICDNQEGNELAVLLKNG